MARTDLKKMLRKNRKSVERFLKTATKPVTLSQISKVVMIPLSTVKRHLDSLVSTGLVHAESFGSFNLYSWNTQLQNLDRLELSENHFILIDSMIDIAGKRLIRVHESIEIDGNSRDSGALVFDPERLPELASKLTKVARAI